MEIPLRTVTATLLESADSATSPALDRLVPILYGELREMAERQLAYERGASTIQATELVHEVYLRLVDADRATGRGRAYFFGAAARAMRQILIESARRRGAVKRGGGAEPVTLEEGHLAVDAYAGELVDLDRALNDLETRSPRQARVVECRYFGGLDVMETAAALDISPRTVKSDWALARAFLYSTLRERAADGGS